ncbi:MAG: hypothetical protein ABIP54_03125, partial [Candidatus Andersenbacteria bacterium]
MLKVLGALLVIIVVVTMIRNKNRVMSWFRLSGFRLPTAKWTVSGVLLAIVFGPIVIAGMIFWILPFIMYRAPIAIATGDLSGILPASTPQVARPKEVAVQNLITWGTETVATLRKQVVTEETFMGCCFVEMIPPATRVELRTVCKDPTNAPPWEVYLTEYNIAGFIQPDNMAKYAVVEYGIRDGLFHFSKLGSRQRKMDETSGLTNVTTRRNPVLGEYYFQTSDLGNHRFSIDRGEQVGCLQYLVKIEKNGATFEVPSEGWKWLWVAAVHMPEYQSAFGNEIVSAAGYLRELPRQLSQLQDEPGFYNK